MSNDKTNVWSFVEKHYPNYSSCDAIAENNDLQCIINGEIIEGSSASKLFQQIKDELNVYNGYSLEFDEIETMAFKEAEIRLQCSNADIYEKAIQNYLKQDSKPVTNTENQNQIIEELDKLHINDLKKLFPKAFAPLVADIETIASYIETDLECGNINENADLDSYLAFSEMYLHFGWICTDPDNKQYCKKASEGHYHGKKLSDGHYLFKELNPKYKLDPENEYKWIEKDILLKAFTDDQINNHISAYYSSIDQIKELYGEDWELVVAECIFEQESGLY